MKKQALPNIPLFSEAVLAGAPVLPKPRAEMLAAIESGEMDHLDFPAKVFKRGSNLNFYTFLDSDLPAFAASFVGQPFLRNHDTGDIGSRDGTILESVFDGSHFNQVIRLTTRQGMTDYVEGRIDRFSIGWHQDDVICTVCNSSWINCVHMRGREYDTPKGKKVCELLFINPKGKETSAVNWPAVSDTGLLSAFDDFKQGIIGGGSPAVSGAQGALHSVSPKGETMKKKVRRNGEVLEVLESEVLPTDEVLTESSDPRLAQIEETRRAAAALLGEQERLAALEAQQQEADALLVAQCGHLLNTGLATSRLPEIVQARLRKQFEGRKFQPAELQTAIDGARDEVSALTAGNIVSGPGRVSGAFSEADQFRLAVEDLLGIERDPADVNKKVHRLSGIREAYLLGTGDTGLMGQYDPEFALGAATDFTVVIKNALNKRLIASWAKLERTYGWWKKIVTVEHFNNLLDVDWMIFGTIGSLPTVSKGGDYQELPIGDNGETSSWTKYGGYVGITLEDIINDNARAFRRLPDEIAMGGIRNISEQVAAIFTSNSGAGPTMRDGGALFNATAVTTAGGHKNLLTNALGTDLTAWRAVETAMFKQPMLIKNVGASIGTGKPQGVKPKFCLVPQDLYGAAADLFLKNWNDKGPNMGYGVEPVVVPEWTDATDWAAVADPDLLPGIMLGEIFGVVPQIVIAGSEKDPAFFANDEARYKVRQFLTVGIANWRALHKNNVAG